MNARNAPRSARPTRVHIHPTRTGRAPSAVDGRVSAQSSFLTSGASRVAIGTPPGAAATIVRRLLSGVMTVPSSRRCGLVSDPYQRGQHRPQAHASMSRLTATPWVTQLRADYRALTKRAGRELRGTRIAGSARLADSCHAEELDAVLATVAEDPRDAELALARGRRALVHNRSDDAMRWLVQAQSLAGTKAPLVVARIAFLLGSTYVSRNELVTADSILAWAEGMLGRRSATSADVLHLRALLAEARGERDESMALYRDVLKRANAALTPISRVIAMRNLAEALAHSEPHESSALYGLALAVLDANELDTAMRCTIDNGMGYALLCGGDIEGARLKLDQALTEARRVNSARVQLYARFNLSIVDELSGDLARSQAELRDVEVDAGRYGVEGLAPWVRIRLAWLQLRSGTSVAAR